VAQPIHHFKSPLHKAGPHISAKKAAFVVVALLLVYLVYSALQPEVVDITSARTVSLSLNQTVLMRMYGGEAIAVKLVSTSNFSSKFFITRLPILYSSVISVTLNQASSANVSSNGTSAADMNLKLSSSNSKGASIFISPLPANLGIGRSGSITILPPANFTFRVSTGNTITLSTTTSTTSLTTTTTIHNATAELLQQAMTLANQTSIGTLMNKYNLLYAKDAKCNQSIYNATYNTYYHSNPPAPASFANMSRLTPTSIGITESVLTTPNNVQITYSTLSPSADSTGPAVMVIINASSTLYYLKSVVYVGIYQGLNYTLLNNSYDFQSKILNFCGAYISPTS